MGSMLRLLCGVAAAVVLVTACGSKDDKRSARPEEGGAGGQAGEAGVAPNDAGAGSEAAGAAGAPEAGGNAGSPGGGAASAGAPSGGEPAAGGAGGEAGETGAAPVQTSPVCGAGNWDAGEGGCQPCVEPAATVQLTCLDFDAVLEAAGGLSYVDLGSFVTLREPFESTAQVRYVAPDQSVSYPLPFNLGSMRFRIQLDGAPADPAEVVVEPFTTVGACGDVFQSIEPIRFVRLAADVYQVSCSVDS